MAQGSDDTTYPKLREWLSRPSALMLVAVNLIPLFGAAFLGWSVGELLLIYWMETVVIGVFNLPKILTSGMEQGGVARGCGVVYLAVFFTLHYGIFNFGHYTFIRDIFGAPRPDAALLLAAAGLSFSHLFSLVTNWFGRKEYVGADANTQMFKPYGRVVILHLVILIGGAVSMALGSPLFALAMLVALKIVFDLWAHAYSHGWIKPIPVDPD